MEKFSSPGRIEICGNHTDHNHGKVLVAAIDLEMIAETQKTDDSIIRIDSAGFGKCTVDLNELKPDKAEYGKSSALVRGVARGFKDRKFNIGGFTARITSTVPRGAGVSSSAAFEVLIAQILNEYYNGGKLDKNTLAAVSQYSENVFFGKPCGLLDQMGIAHGGITYIDFFEPAKPVVKTLQLPLRDYSIIITNTGGDHSNLTDHYAAVREEMHAVARCFDKEYLADVSVQDFYANIGELQKAVSGRAILRAAHFFNENERVELAAKAVTIGNMGGLFAAVNESGESSYKLLQNNYTENDTMQRIPLALFMSKRIMTDGAVRVHGGGFSGTILAFVRNDEREKYISTLSPVFGRENIYVTAIRKTGTCKI